MSLNNASLCGECGRPAVAAYSSCSKLMAYYCGNCESRYYSAGCYGTEDQDTSRLKTPQPPGGCISGPPRILTPPNTPPTPMDDVEISTIPCTKKALTLKRIYAHHHSNSGAPSANCVGPPPLKQAKSSSETNLCPQHSGYGQPPTQEPSTGRVPFEKTGSSSTKRVDIPSSGCGPTSPKETSSATRRFTPSEDKDLDFKCTTVCGSKSRL